MRPEKLPQGVTRDDLINAITAENIPCFSGSCSEIYLEQCFVKNQLGPKHRLQNAKVLGETALMFLEHPTLTTTDINKMIAVVTSVLEKVTQSSYSLL